MTRNLTVPFKRSAYLVTASPVTILLGGQAQSVSTSGHVIVKQRLDN